MRLPLAAFSLFAFISAANAEPKDLAVDSEPPKQSPREVALDNLLSERDSDQALESVIKEAKANGIKEQAILEARFLYHIDRREDDAIAAMLPEFLKQQGLFKIEDSAIFSVKEDWLAVTEYVQAIASLKKGDKDAFKSHITEAFWLSPRQASAFAPQIDRLRLEESMRSVKIDFETRLIALREGDAIALKSLMQDKKAMIFHFWSPASRECEATLPDFVITAKHLSGKGIAVVSILSDSTPQIITDARAMIHPLGPEAPIAEHQMTRPFAFYIVAIAIVTGCRKPVEEIRVAGSAVSSQTPAIDVAADDWLVWRGIAGDNKAIGQLPPLQ